MLHSVISAPLRSRVATDVILGAVSTWDLVSSRSDLYFKRSELAMLFADSSYPYRNEGDFIRAVEARMEGCQIIAKPYTDRLIVRLNPKNAQEILTQIMGVRAVADMRCEVPTR